VKLLYTRSGTSQKTYGGLSASGSVCPLNDKVKIRVHVSFSPIEEELSAFGLCVFTRIKTLLFRQHMCNNNIETIIAEYILLAQILPFRSSRFNFRQV
jgi:hypothetical protein